MAERTIKAIFFDWGWTLHDPEHNRLFSGVEELLKKLSNRYALALIALAKREPVVQRKKKIKASGLERYFSLILVDSDHKDALYDKALKKLKVQASEIVVVDDRVVRGIAWGNRVGATTIWVKRGKFADELPTKATGYPTYTISDIEACAKIIDSIDQKQTGIQVPQGIYKHFKGGMYRVIGTAKHSETLEDLVVYEALYSNKGPKLWIRPLDMFLETVEMRGKSVPRFEPMNHNEGFENLIVDIHVQNLKRAVEFYEKTLGMTLLHKAKGWASLDAHGSEIHLYLHGGATEGIEFRVKDIAGEVRRLKQAGVEFMVNKIQKDVLRVEGKAIMVCLWGKIAFFQDTQGNQLALVEDQTAHNNISALDNLKLLP